MLKARNWMALLVAPWMALGCGGTTIEAKLAEWSIKLDSASAPAGEVTFVTENVGADVHELVVLKTDIAHDMLPLGADGNVNEAAAGIKVAGEVEDIAPGKTEELTLDLEAGSYALICNISM